MTRLVLALLTICVLTQALIPALAGPPKPVSYCHIPDPSDDAERHIVVDAQDRGPVWLLTGFLINYTPNYDPKLIAGVKPRHWRNNLWPFWWPSTLVSDHRPKWSDIDERKSAEGLGKYMDDMMKLREQGMTWQLILHHIGPFSGVYTHPKSQMKDYYHHIYTIMSYARHMGMPVDYWEVDNEPVPGPYEGMKGYSLKVTWREYLDYWDTAYKAIRAAFPNAKIVGPSYGVTDAKTIEPFLAHCKKKGQRVDVLSWHEINQHLVLGKPDDSYYVLPDLVHKNIEQIRRLVETKYPMLGVKEYHIDEWGDATTVTGVGTQIAFFHYMELAGVDRAARATWTEYDLNGILVDPKTPRSSYWAWKAYADGTGVRLVTNTNDRCVVAIASRDDATKTVRAVVARSVRNGFKNGLRLPPVKTKVDFKGLPFSSAARVTILRLGPDDDALPESELPGRTTISTQDVSDNKLTVVLDRVAENEVYSICLEEKR